MYSCIIDVRLIGCEFNGEELFSCLPMPTDCELNFGDSESPDRITVYGNAELYFQRKEKGMCAIITDGKEIPDDLIDDVELWCIPDCSPVKEKLLKNYFLRLVKLVKSNFDMRRYKICLETAADSVPDLIWFKDLNGAHLMTNLSFCDVVGKTKEQVYKKGHYYIWDIPEEEYKQGNYVCLESEDEIIKAGKTRLFKEKVKTKNGMKRFKTYKTPLYDIDGRLFGTCGVARDIADLRKIINELNVVVKSIPFGIMIEDKNEKLISYNSSLTEYFPEIRKYRWKDCREWKKRFIGNKEKTGIFETEKNGLPCILSFSREEVKDDFGEVIGKVTIFNDVTAEKLSQKQSLEYANTDFLTKLNNRRSLSSYIAQIRKTPYLSMIAIDLDNFKKINDSLGHAVGDEVLVETAKMLKKHFKEDFSVRLGGDEFLVVIKRNINKDELEKEAQSLIDEFNEKYKNKTGYTAMTMSAGLAMAFLEDGYEHDIETLMYSSDCALYEAKKEGKSRCAFYEKIIS